MTYIDPRGKVLRHLDRLVGWNQGQKPAPVTVEWDLSNRCVLGCQDCHFAHTHVKGPWASKSRLLPMAFDGTGDLADAAMVRRSLDEMQRAGVQSVIWSGGGEPTTHPEWTDIIAHAHHIGMKQGMYTLGGLLSTSTAYQLATQCEWVVVSLDCATAEDYAREKGVPASRFHAACEGISMLSAVGRAVVGVSFLLHEKNWRQAPQMLKLARSLGATYTTFRPAIQTSADRPGVPLGDRSWVDDACERNYPVYVGSPMFEMLSRESDVEIDVDRFRAYRDWQGHGYTSCQGIRLNATVTPDGRVWICPQKRGVQGACVGDLTTESFGELWAKHPGQWTDFSQCRVMCRLHPINEQMAALSTPHVHEAFI